MVSSGRQNNHGPRQQQPFSPGARRRTVFGWFWQGGRRKAGCWGGVLVRRSGRNGLRGRPTILRFTGHRLGSSPFYLFCRFRTPIVRSFHVGTSPFWSSVSQRLWQKRGQRCPETPWALKRPKVLESVCPSRGTEPSPRQPGSGLECNKCADNKQSESRSGF